MFEVSSDYWAKADSYRITPLACLGELMSKGVERKTTLDWNFRGKDMNSPNMGVEWYFPSLSHIWKFIQEYSWICFVQKLHFLRNFLRNIWILLMKAFQEYGVLVFLLKAILPFGPFSAKSINTAVFLLLYVNQELLNRIVAYLFQLCSIHGQNIVAQQMSGDGPVQVWGWVVRSLFVFLDMDLRLQKWMNQWCVIYVWQYKVICDNLWTVCSSEFINSVSLHHKVFGDASLLYCIIAEINVMTWWMRMQVFKMSFFSTAHCPDC